jgi:hypothetical protein
MLLLLSLFCCFSYHYFVVVYLYHYSAVVYDYSVVDYHYSAIDYHYSIAVVYSWFLPSIRKSLK